MFYSSTPRNDGFGAQFQNILWDILYVREYLHEDYVLTLTQKMEHNYENDSDFIIKLFEFMNLRKIYKLNSEIEGPIQYLPTGHTYGTIQANLTNFMESDTMNELKKVFFEDKKNPFDADHFNIALHIRRMNKNDTREIYITEHQYVEFFNKLKDQYPEKNVRFHIYSQGTISEFKDYESDRTIFHIDESVQDTFLGFVYADVLVCTSSSFSYLAAHYNKNKIYAFKFWHELSKKWEVIS